MIRLHWIGRTVNALTLFIKCNKKILSCGDELLVRRRITTTVARKEKLKCPGIMIFEADVDLSDWHMIINAVKFFLYCMLFIEFSLNLVQSHKYEAPSEKRSQCLWLANPASCGRIRPNTRELGFIWKWISVTKIY